jgi:uncharacterized protein (DUF1015 family)
MIRPFRAYRPHPKLIEKIVCPPYNELSSHDAREYAKNNPYSFLRVCRPEVEFTPNIQPYSRKTGLRGRENLVRFIEKKWLIRDDNPCFYIYRQSFENKKIFGIIGEISTQLYRDKFIKLHENTIPKKEIAMTEFMDLENSHVDPILLTYKSSSDYSNNINLLVNSLTQTNTLQQFVDEKGTHHTIWPIDDYANIKKISKLFSSIQTFYIADGHHRSAAAYNISIKKKQQMIHNGEIITGKESFNYLLTALFPDKYIHLLSYNRIIRDLNNWNKSEFFIMLKQNFDVQEISVSQQTSPSSQHQISMYLDKKWYSLKVLQHIIKLRQHDASKNLDMKIISEIIFRPILNINSLDDHTRIECVGGNISKKDLEVKCEKMGWRLAFVLHPVTMNQFTNIIDLGKLMPAKTTWFEPKMRPGLFVRTLEK